MKKSNLYWLLSLVMVLMMNLSFTSCGDDEKDDDPKPASIQASDFYGKWKCDSLSVEGVQNPMISALNGATFDFKEELVNEANGSVEGPWGPNGAMIPVDYVWSYANNTVTMKIYNYNVVFSIVEFKENQVKLYAEMKVAESTDDAVSKINATMVKLAE